MFSVLYPYTSYELNVASSRFNELGSMDTPDKQTKQITKDVSKVFDRVISANDLSRNQKQLICQGIVSIWVPHQHGGNPCDTVRFWQPHPNGKTIGTSEPVEELNLNATCPRFLAVNQQGAFPVEFQNIPSRQTAADAFRTTEVIRYLADAITKETSTSLGVSVNYDRDPKVSTIEKNFRMPNSSIRSEVEVMQTRPTDIHNNKTSITEYGYSGPRGHCQPIFYGVCEEDAEGRHYTKFEHAHDPR